MISEICAVPVKALVLLVKQIQFIISQKQPINTLEIEELRATIMVLV